MAVAYAFASGSDQRNHNNSNGLDAWHNVSNLASTHLAILPLTRTVAFLSHAQVIRNVIDQAVVADEVGVDFFGLGEHRRADFAVSSPRSS